MRFLLDQFEDSPGLAGVAGSVWRVSGSARQTGKSEDAQDRGHPPLEKPAVALDGPLSRQQTKRNAT
jgi:hypothetical protein